MKTWLTGSLRSLAFVFLPALVLLPGCGAEYHLEKQLVLVVPDSLLGNRDANKRFEDSPLWRTLRTYGTRYAYILPINDTLSILKTHAMEVKGNFDTWEGPVFCGVGVDFKARHRYRYRRVDADFTLTTFAVTDPHYKRHVYINGQSADTNLHKFDLPFTHRAAESTDTSTYVLTKTSATGQTQHFCFKGQRGPDFRNIAWHYINPATNTYRYVGTPFDPSLPQIPVINGKVYREYPVAHPAAIPESRFGDLYFTFMDTLRKKQGYWINGTPNAARFDRVAEITFHGKNDYAFVGIDDTLIADTFTHPLSGSWVSRPKAYYLVRNDSVSRPYKYIAVTEGQSAPSYPSAGPRKVVMVDDDSVFCYQDNQLVYQNRFAYSEDINWISFDYLQKPARTVLKMSCYGSMGNEFCVDGKCFTEKIPLVDENGMEVSFRELHKYLGVSRDRTKYARIAYAYPDDQTMQALLYVNDSLVGTCDPHLELLWNHDDGFLLKDYYGTLKHGLRSGQSRDTLQYQKYVAKHYPHGVPPILEKALLGNEEIRIGRVTDKIPFTYLSRHFDMPGHSFYSRDGYIDMGVTDNNHFYHAITDKPRFNDVLYVDFETAYDSEKLYRLTQEGNYLSFYSLEGNKLYLVTLDLNDWWTRLFQFLACGRPAPLPACQSLVNHFSLRRFDFVDEVLGVAAEVELDKLFVVVEFEAFAAQGGVFEGLADAGFTVVHRKIPQRRRRAAGFAREAAQVELAFGGLEHNAPFAELYHGAGPAAAAVVAQHVES
jgi:hypothetical protein